MIANYLWVSGIDPKTPTDVLCVAAHSEFPLSNWFVGQQWKQAKDDTGGFARLSELCAACLDFHWERDIGTTCRVFGPPLRTGELDLPEKTDLDTLKTVAQRGTVLHFVHRLEEKFLSFPELLESYKIHDFLSGLMSQTFPPNFVSLCLSVISIPIDA